MSTSKLTRAFRDSFIAAASASVIALALSPTNPALTAAPFHPSWIVALILVARYGASGLYSVPAVVVGVETAVWIAGGAEASAFARLSRPGELFLLLAIAMIAAVGALHQRRTSTLKEQLDEAEARATKAEDAVDDLCESAIVLRERADRSQTSLTFLTDFAMQLENPDPAGAGDAALALAMARTNARGGFVQLFDNGRLRTLCSRGIWSSERLDPPALFRDLVANAAVENKRPMAAHEVARVTIDDSDLAAPLLDTRGAVVGVLALRGIAYPALGAAARDDLAAVARWAGRAFEKPLRGSPAPNKVRGDVHAAL
jgi:hypothetical protein